jgi:hypothetical protein
MRGPAALPIMGARPVIPEDCIIRIPVAISG